MIKEDKQIISGSGYITVEQTLTCYIHSCALQSVRSALPPLYLLPLFALNKNTLFCNKHIDRAYRHQHFRG